MMTSAPRRYYVGLALLMISGIAVYGGVLLLLFLLNPWAFVIVVVVTITAAAGLYLMETGLPNYSKEIEQLLKDRRR